MEIETIATESLGNRGYLIHDGVVGAALDVQRDYDRWIEAAKTAGVQITHVFETHMHNDYVTGGLSTRSRA
jgi:hydroxyacylglutathione hydrolase